MEAFSFVIVKNDWELICSYSVETDTEVICADWYYVYEWVEIKFKNMDWKVFVVKEDLAKQK